MKKLEIFLKNFVCLAIWTWVTSKLIGYKLPIDNYIYSLHEISFISVLVIVIIFIFLIIIIGKVWSVFLFFSQFLSRLIFFPFAVVPYYFIRIIKSLYRYLNKIFSRFVRTTILKASILILLLILTSIITVMYSQDIWYLLISIILTIFVLLIVLRACFYWTTKPLVVFEELLNMCIGISGGIMKVIINHANQQKEPMKQYDTIKNYIPLYRNGIKYSEDFISKNTNYRVIIKGFTLLFGIAFLLVVLSFGMIYFALNKINPLAFAMSSPESILDYVYSSLLIITTSGEIRPIWWVAKLTVSLEIICGISMFTLLIYRFSMISQNEIQEARKSIKEKILNQKDYINNIEEEYIKRTQIEP